MIIGEDKPDAGSIKIGETVKLGYVDQDRSLDGNKTVYEVISEGQETIKLGKVEVNARGYCARFNFAGTDQQKKVRIYRAVSATVSISRGCSRKALTSSSWTSPQTTST